MMWLVRMVRASMRARLGLLSLVVGAMTLVVMVPAALPMFADGASARALGTRDFRPDANRAPFAYMFSYSGALHGAIDWSDVVPVDDFLSAGEASLGLPARYTARYVSTATVQLHSVIGSGAPLTNNGVEFTVHEHIEELVEIDGRWPSADGSAGVVEVAISSAFAQQVGVRVGDELLVLDDAAALGSNAAQRRVRVSALWTAVDRADERWIVDPSQLDNRLIVPLDTLAQTLTGDRPGLVETVRWYSLLDPTSLSTSRVPSLVRSAEHTESRAAQLLEGVRLDLDPVDELRDFKAEAEELNRTLQVYAIAPLVALALFIVFVLGIGAEGRTRELALLRTRGASASTAVSVVAAEAIVVSSLAVALGLLGATPLARMLGRASSFMRFDGRSIQTELGSASVKRAVVVGLILIVVQLACAVTSLRQNRVTVAARFGRAVGAPWWQRFGLDVAVIAGGSAAVWVTVTDTRPAVALGGKSVAFVPVLAGVAAGLAVVRLVPRFAERLAAVVSVGSGVSLLIGLRRVARAPSATALPIVLFVLSLSSAFFTASLARTLDTEILDREYARVGTDWVVQETDAVVAPLLPGGVEGAAPTRRLATMSTIESIPGVTAATRVGRYDATLSTNVNVDFNVVYVGVDASTFANVAAYPPNRAGVDSVPLGMLRLGTMPEGVLVPAEFGLTAGDTVTLRLTVNNAPVSYRAVVVGLTGTIPGAGDAAEAQSETGPSFTVVGNLDFLFQITGDPVGYSVWIRTESPSAVSEAELRESLLLLSLSSPQPAIERRLAAPVRQGIFALLTIGFVVSLIAATLSLVIGTAFTLRRSFTEFGALQALGLRPRQVGAVIAVELAAVVVVGVGAGLGSGWLMSRFLMARLVAGGGADGLHVSIASDSIAALVAPLVACVALAVGAASVTLRRRSLFELLRMGADE